MFSQISKSLLFNHVKRLAIVCVFLSISAAAASIDWDARYYVENVKILPGSTGSGLVYIDPQTEAWAGTEASNTYGDYRGTERVKEGELPTTKNGGKLTFNVTHQDVSDDENNYTFNNLYLKVNMSNYSYSTFDGWYEDDGNGGYKFVNAETYALSSTVNKSPGYYHEEKNIYAKFTAFTYYAEKLPVINIITVDANGSELKDGIMGGVNPTLTLSNSGPNGITMGNRVADNDKNYFSQTADNYGKNEGASFLWEVTNPNPSLYHKYLGWKLTEGDNVQTGNIPGKAMSRDSNNPTSHTIYIVYQRDKFNMWRYIEGEDKFEDDVMNYTDGSVYVYEKEIYTDVKEKIYRILPGLAGNITATCDKDFTATIDVINGIQILRVKPLKNSGSLDGIVTISIAGTAVAQLPIAMANTPIYVTLNPAEDLTGSYSYTQNTTSTEEFEVTTSPVVKQMMTATDYSFTFAPTPVDASKYQFEKWVIKDKDGNVVEERIEQNLSYTFQAGQSITPVFTTIDRAIYMVKSEPNARYIQLQAALDRAKVLKDSKGDEQVVVVTVEGKRKGGRLVKGNYTIPQGVTLLVPGNVEYTPLYGPLTEDDFVENSNLSTFCTFQIEDGTNMNVDGKISLYGQIASVQGSTGKVGVHGLMKLGKNCSITVNNGGELHAFGFIQGDPSSQITMEKGATAYEAFYFRDWRGGSEVANMRKNSQGVFPMGQYYVQNIEIPITFKYGAKEYLTTCVLLGQGVGKVATNMLFIGEYKEKTNKPSDDIGFLQIGSGTTLTKQYIPETDRLAFTFLGDGTQQAIAKLGHMALNMKVLFIPVDVDSKDFVMPIQNNLDISLHNTKFLLQYSVAFLPGSKIHIDEDAALTIASGVQLYLYDRGARRLADGGNGGYWSAYNGVLYTNNARPGGMKYTRSENNLVDAKMVVNGEVIVNGELCTVKGKYADEDSVEPEGGANITSEGGGKMIVNAINANRAVTYQWKQEQGAQEIALTSPNLLLHNDKSKGATSAYTSVSSPATYTYYLYNGTWQTTQPGITGIALYDNTGKKIEKFEVTLPNAGEQSGYLYAYLETGTYILTDFTYNATSGNGFTWNPSKASIDGNILKVPVTYTPQNIHGEHKLEVSITYGDNTTPFMLSATEDYQPLFTASSILHINGRINESVPVALPIEPALNNVVTLSEDNGVALEWEVQMTGSSQFQFAFGEGDGNKLSGAKVIFTPNTTEQVAATLTLTATYTDVANPVNKLKKVHTVQLTGNGFMTDNTLEFNNVGTITTNTSPFELLKNINSTGKISVETTQVGSETVDQVLTITKNDDTDYSNYTITPNGVGQVKIVVKQESTTTHTAKPEIEKIIVIVADPKSLTDVSCVDSEDNFNYLTSEVKEVAYTDDQIQFTNTEGVSIWAAHFNSMPGTLTFTPNGNGYWAIQESKDGVNWSEIIWWTQLPSEEVQTIPLHPTSRKLQIAYIPSTSTDLGYITGLCINPFTIYAETTKLYLPVINGAVEETQVVFTHSTSSVNITGPTNWTLNKSTTDNLGGVLNTYYQTTATISGTNVQEKNDGFTLTATQGSDEVEVALSTYTFPKPLPIQSVNWKTNNSVADDVNGYDEAEHYYWYMVASEFVKWDAEHQNVVFLNTGSAEDPSRQVVFGYYGLPDEVRFQSLSTEWMIEESSDNVNWSPAEEGRAVSSEDGVNEIVQPINHTSKYVRITYIGTEQTEVLLNNLVIEGFPSAVAPEEVILSKNGEETEATGEFAIHVMNLDQMKLILDNTTKFNLSYNSKDITNESIFTSDDADCLAMNEEGDINIQVKWQSDNIVDEAKVIIYDAAHNTPLDTVRIIGKKSALTKDDVNTGLFTGVPETYELKGAIFEQYAHRPVMMTNAFDSEGNALFDYLFIYGETTTNDTSKIITEPTNTAGSNAKTPYYIYMKKNNTYEFVQAVENANYAFKASLDKIPHQSVAEGANGRKAYAIVPSEDGTPLKIYMTGFCPYATTGCTSDDEGVWYFRGKPGTKLHLYLEDCHIYSRNKTQDGRYVGKNDPYGSSFTGSDVVKGSGAVFVFENYDALATDDAPAFDVTIHTLGRNILKSNYGSYYTMIGTAQATQVSSPIQIRLAEGLDFEKAKTTLTFDDIWLGKAERTNGFLSLQKRVNNAPSIDLGNRNTVVNFRGGQVELQNAQIVSPNYKTTLAISFRSGEFGNIGIGFAKGVGTDDASGGTVHFYDGTTTVRPMKVDPTYQAYYLMDKDDPNTTTDESQYTSCLRCPTNTFVHGGTHCMIRSCIDVTSKGGAPKDTLGNLLGRYTYTAGTTPKGENQLVTPNNFPGDLQYKGQPLLDYHKGYPNGKYGLESVTPDAGGQLYFWIPEGVVSDVRPETDGLVTPWKACMTEITASALGYEGSIGGITYVEEDEVISNLLYCQLDTFVHSVISAHTGSEELGNLQYSYSAPVVDPTDKLDDPYLYITPTHVGNKPQEHIVAEVNDYKVNNKIYYITTALADTWMNFCMPFDVQKIWVVEPYQEAEIEKYYKTILEKIETNEPDKEPSYYAALALDSTLRFQARHNADFAAFFGVAMAIGADNLSFQDIFDRYHSWAENRADAAPSETNPRGTGLFTGGTYDLRGKYPLTHYDGSNFVDAHYYLYHNEGDWTMSDEEGRFRDQWKVVPKVAEGGVLMRKHEVYSMLFPYCWGCEDPNDENDVRNYWDYWTGKFLIFESTAATPDKPHVIKDSTYVAPSKIGNNAWVMDDVSGQQGSAVLLGNSTFSMMKVPDNNEDFLYNNEDFLLYDGSTRGLEGFTSGVDMDVDSITPTTTFLIANTIKPIQQITRSGIITYRHSDDDGNITTGGNMPTVGNGARLFITAIDNGINVAVSTPQYIRVVTSAGMLIYSGEVTMNVDIPLPTSGVYIVTGEGEVQKIIY